MWAIGTVVSQYHACPANRVRMVYIRVTQCSSGNKEKRESRAQSTHRREILWPKHGAVVNEHIHVLWRELDCVYAQGHTARDDWPVRKRIFMQQLSFTNTSCAWKTICALRSPLPADIFAYCTNVLAQQPNFYMIWGTPTNADPKPSRPKLPRRLAF